MEKAIAIIPAKSEEQTVGMIVERAVRHCDVVVVNDHSCDQTAAMAMRAGASVIDLANTTGYGAALIAGWREALKRGYDLVMTFDADGAHDPTEIPRLIRSHQSSHAMLTIGNRFADAGSIAIPSPKYWANHFGTCVVNGTLGLALEDVACGFRVMNRELIKMLLGQTLSEGFGIVLNILEGALKLGGLIVGCPVSVHYSAEELHGTAQRELLDALRILRTRVAPENGEVAQRMIQTVERMSRFTVLVGERTLCAHPVGQCYIFQNHPSELPAPQFGETFTFDCKLHESGDD